MLECRLVESNGVEPVIQNGPGLIEYGPLWPNKWKGWFEPDDWCHVIVMIRINISRTGPDRIDSGDLVEQEPEEGEEEK